MEAISHVADDYAAIARRLKELAAENEKAEQRASQPVYRTDAGDPPYRLRRSAGDSHRTQFR